MKAKIGLVAGRGIYPRLVMEGAESQGMDLAVAAFHGETDPKVASRGQPTQWLRVGQLGGLISFFKKAPEAKVVRVRVFCRAGVGLCFTQSFSPAETFPTLSLYLTATLAAHGLTFGP